MDEIKTTADAVVRTVKAYVSAELSAVLAELSQVTQRLVEIENRPVTTEKGERGADGDIGPPGPQGAEGPQGPIGPPGPAGEKGMDGKDGCAGDMGLPGPVGEKGIDGRDGRDGEPGRDAAHIDVLASIDPDRRYQRGTYATHEGGLLRAFRGTDPLDEAKALDACGWQVVVNGIAAVSVDQPNDRTLAVRVRTTDGATTSSELKVASMIYREIFRDEAEYEKGDCVTFGGSLWIAQKDAPQGKPGTSADWRLAVKKGRDGRGAP